MTILFKSNMAGLQNGYEYILFKTLNLNMCLPLLIKIIKTCKYAKNTISIILIIFYIFMHMHLHFGHSKLVNNIIYYVND